MSESIIRFHLSLYIFGIHFDIHQDILISYKIMGKLMPFSYLYQIEIFLIFYVSSCNFEKSMSQIVLKLQRFFSSVTFLRP